MCDLSEFLRNVDPKTVSDWDELLNQAAARIEALEKTEAKLREALQQCAAIADDLQFSADAAFNARVARARKGEKHLELAAATAAGMSHQARKAGAAIRALISRNLQQ